MRSSNPALQTFVRPDTYAQRTEKVMTVRGTITASAILTGLCAIAAITTYGWLASGTNASLAWERPLGAR